MTATLDRPLAAPALSVNERSSFRAVVASEWVKLRSVRSTWWSLLATAAITIGVSVLLCWAYVNRYDQLSAKEKASLDPTLLSLRGVFLAQLAVGVLGVLFIGSEHTTGMIRTTFTAVPARRRVLAAKATVVAAVSAVVGAISTFTAFFVGQAILSTKHIGVSFFSPGVPRALLGASAYFVLIALLAFGLGAILRSTPG